MTLLQPPADMLIPAWQWFLATWFGAGLVEPLRAGLAVSTAGIVVLVLSRRERAALPLLGLVILLLGVFVSSVIGDATGVKDDRRIVIDEVAAFILGAAFLRRVHWTVLVIFGSAFLYLDRIKPWPFFHLETLPAGWGVMADDLGLGLALGTAFFIALTVRRKLRNA
jgi:phosphatidylglycerophosphatase A